MTAYLFVDITVADPAGMDGYRAAVLRELAASGARPLVVGPVQRLEGEWNPAGLVVLAFDDAEQARTWYEANGHHNAGLLRDPAVVTSMVLARGIDPAGDGSG